MGLYVDLSIGCTTGGAFVIPKFGKIYSFWAHISIPAAMEVNFYLGLSVQRVAPAGQKLPNRPPSNLNTCVCPADILHLTHVEVVYA